MNGQSSSSPAAFYQFLDVDQELRRSRRLPRAKSSSRSNPRVGTRLLASTSPPASRPRSPLSTNEPLFRVSHQPTMPLRTTSLRLFLNSQRSRLTCSPSHLSISSNTQARMVATSAPRKNQAKTFAYQEKLPRLPVPDLEQSLQGYIKSLTPVLEQKVRFHMHVLRECGSDSVVDGMRLRQYTHPRNMHTQRHTPSKLKNMHLTIFSTDRTPSPRSSRSASSTPRTLRTASDAFCRSASRVSGATRVAGLNCVHPGIPDRQPEIYHEADNNQTLTMSRPTTGSTTLFGSLSRTTPGAPP